jgi:serine/threonine protein kinase
MPCCSSGSTASPCDSKVSLTKFGLEGEGCIRNSTWLASISVPCRQSLLIPALYVDTTAKKICQLKTVATGTFGSIDVAQRIDSSGATNVFVKKPRIAGRSLLYEALLQDKVQQSLATGGFPTGAPRVHDIFKLHDGSVCFTMELIEAAETLETVLEKAAAEQLAPILIEALLQVCAMIWHLEQTLGMNHRDLKPSNLLLRFHEPTSRTLVIGQHKLEIESRFTITFIDFGFSCMGSADTQKADISLSSVYSAADPCPKQGRDLYSFLAFIYAELWNRLPADLACLFETWLHVPGSKMTGFLRKNKAAAKDWIYFLTGNVDIKSFDCCPCRIVADLAKFMAST